MHKDAKIHGVYGQMLIDALHLVDNNISITIGFLIGFKSHKFKKLIPVRPLSDKFSSSEDEDCVDGDSKNYEDDAGSASFYY